MAARVDRQPTVGAGGTARSEHPFSLPGERHDLLRRGPEPGGGQGGGIVVLVLWGLPGDDDEQPAVLVITQTELADGPFRVAGVSGRRLDALGRRPQPLSFEELADADDQTLDVELLTIEDDGLTLPAGAQEELAPPRRTDRPDADAVNGIEVYASRHGVRVPFCTIREVVSSHTLLLVSRSGPGGKLAA